MDSNDGGGGTVTSNATVLLLTPAIEAEMSVLPAKIPVARPEAPMVAMLRLELFQMTEFVMSWLVPSL